MAENMKFHKAEPQISSLYEEKLRKFKFMQQYIAEPEIFNVGSVKFKEFLIHSLTNLHTDFAYLSFLNPDDADQELVKVLGTLQIVSMHSVKKHANIFENWSENDICKFWTKFFSVCEILVNEHYSFEHSLTLESKLSFMKDMNNIFTYLNYEFPICNYKKLSSVNINDEISKWTEEFDIELNTTVEEASIDECEDESLFIMNTQKLISDLKHIMTAYDLLETKKSESQMYDVKLINDLITLTTEVISYSKNCEIVEMKMLKKVLQKYFSVKNDKKSENDMYFLKTYGNLISNIRSKINLYF